MFRRLIPVSAIIMALVFIMPGDVAGQSASGDWAVGSIKNQIKFRSTYGINEAIEPRLEASDKSLFDRVSPYLESDPQSAIQILESGMVGEVNPAFYFLLGNLRYEVGEYINAASSLKTAIGKLPTFRRAYRTLGLVHIRTGDYPSAAAAFLKVIEHGGGDAQSYGLLAFSYLELGKFHAALSAYQMARIFDPESFDFQKGMAQCYLMTHQLEMAVAILDEMMADYPGDVDLWKIQTNAFMELNKFDQAIANLVILDQSGSIDSRSLLLLGNLYLQEEIYHLADAAYSRAASRNDGSSSPKDFTKPLGFLASRQLIPQLEQYLKTLKEIPAIVADKQASLDILLADASLNLSAGNHENAQSLFQSIVATDPIHGPALLGLGKVARLNNDFSAAVLNLEKATLQNEVAREAHIELARVYIDRNDFKSALNHLRFVERDSPSPFIARHIEALESALKSSR